MNANLPKSKEELSPKERMFFDTMMQQLPDAGKYYFLRHVAFRFRVPQDFTQEEFERVGHCLTILSWDWEEVGERGKYSWSYMLDPGV